MRILHAFWLPDAVEAFAQGGALWLWAETLQLRPARRAREARPHPFSVTSGDWPALVAEVGLDLSPIELRAALRSCALQLPSAADAPLPSP